MTEVKVFRILMLFDMSTKTNYNRHVPMSIKNSSSTERSKNINRRGRSRSIDSKTMIADPD